MKPLAKRCRKHGRWYYGKVRSRGGFVDLEWHRYTDYTEKQLGCPKGKLSRTGRCKVTKKVVTVKSRKRVMCDKALAKGMKKR